MKYRDFLINYAKENNFQFSQIDENTFKFNSVNGILKVYFRDNENVLDGWGSFIDFSEQFSLNGLKKYLDVELGNKKLIVWVDDCYNVLKQEETSAIYEVKKENFTEGVRFCLVIDFYLPAKLYGVDDGEVVEYPMFKIVNPMDKLKRILLKRNVEYKVKPIYLGELETFDKLVIDQGATILNITSNFTGTRLKLEKESKQMDFSVYKCKVINLINENLEDIDFCL